MIIINASFRENIIRNEHFSYDAERPNKEREEEDKFCFVLNFGHLNVSDR